MSEQLRFTFPQPSVSSSPSSQEAVSSPEPLSNNDRSSFDELSRAILSFESTVKKTKFELVTERLQRVMVSTKGGAYFDGVEFYRTKQEPLARLAQRMSTVLAAIESVLSSDPPPSHNTKTTLYLEGIELLQELRSWDDAAKNTPAETTSQS